MTGRMLLVAVLFLSATLPAVAGSSFSFTIDACTVKKAGAGYGVDLRIAYRGPATIFSGASVPITTERIVIAGNAHGKILERDFLMSRFAYDINGNGNATDEFPAAIRNDTLVIGPTVLDPVLDRRTVNGMQLLSYFDRQGRARLYRIGQAGRPFVVYQLAGSNAVLGITTQEAPVSLEKFPNPNVQVMVVKMQERRFERPSYAIVGDRNFLTFSNERFFPDQTDEWVSIVWAVRDIDVSGGGTRFPVSFALSGIKPPFAVIAAVNCSVDDGVRLRTFPTLRMVDH
ncbi:MAG TPA: hypothetical protein PKJ16_09930 [Spirochaetota bacterium]|nr:hypothetical protein [Spirochaetota bacterium]HPU86989.1 hypothetical protein [Spirochaetota bacterium]